MTNSRRNQTHRFSRQRMSRLIAVAGIAAAAVTVVAYPPAEAMAKPSGGTEVTVAPVVKPQTVVQTTPASSPPIPFATPVVRAPQAGAA